MVCFWCECSCYSGIAIWLENLLVHVLQLKHGLQIVSTRMFLQKKPWIDLSNSIFRSLNMIRFWYLLGLVSFRSLDYIWLWLRYLSYNWFCFGYLDCVCVCVYLSMVSGLKHGMDKYLSESQTLWTFFEHWNRAGDYSRQRYKQYNRESLWREYFSIPSIFLFFWRIKE